MPGDDRRPCGLPIRAQAPCLPQGAAYNPRSSRSLRMTMSDTSPSERPELPERLSTDPASPFHDAKVFEHEVGIRFNGKERTDVVEYSRVEGWIKVPVGSKVDRRGQPLLIKLKGTVEPYYL
jgi:hypothetical protein